MVVVKCPYCGCDLIEDEDYDLTCEGDYVLEYVVGHCEECEREFQWMNRYDYVSFGDLRELPKEE